MQYDILRLLRDYGISYTTKVNRGWANVTCPMPECSDRSDHGGFNISGGYYHCWKCGGHPMERVISKLLRIPYSKASDILFDYSGHASILDKLNKKEARAQTVELPGGDLNRFDYDYLAGRGFDPDFLVDKYALRGGIVSGDWKYRVIIPVFLNGVAVGFQGRDITGRAKLRYKNLEIEKSVVDIKTILYNTDNCTGDSVVLVEGCPDVWRMGDGYAATFGTSFEEAQFSFIRKRYRRVVMLFDPEPQAQKLALRRAYALSSLGVHVETIDLENGGIDPGDLSPTEADKVRDFIGI